MKNTLLVLSFSLMSLVGAGASAEAAEFKYARPSGDYLYKDHFNVTLVRRAEKVQAGTQAGDRRRAELRRSGFNCLRTNQKYYLCVRNERPLWISPAVEAAIQRQLAGFKISFGAPTASPELLIDTSSTQEWVIRDPVTINEAKVGLFKFTYLYGNGEINLSFPVSDEQTVPFVRMDSPDLLALTFTINERYGVQTVGYVIDAELER